VVNIEALLKGLDGANPYQLLQVSRTADDATIVKARRQRLRSAHPDLVGGDAGLATMINIAADLLLDPNARAVFDQRSAAPQQRPAARAARPDPGGARWTYPDPPGPAGQPGPAAQPG
jgi:curved DNA-binding protein CbpA